MSNHANIQINLTGNVFAQIEKLQANFAEVVNVVEKVDSTVNKTISNLVVICFQNCIFDISNTALSKMEAKLECCDLLSKLYL